MKVIYLHQYFNTPNMAGSTRSYEMAKRLVARGHEVHMVTSWRENTDHRGWYEEIIDGIHVHWIPVKYSNKMGFYSRLFAFFHFAILSALKAASLPADVIFATSTPLTIAIPGAYAAIRKGVPLVIEVRDLWPEVPIALKVLKNPLLVKAARWLERFAYYRAARVVVLAPGMAESVVAAGAKSTSVSIVPNGCDVETFCAATAEPIDSFPVVLYIGTVGPANGVDYLPRLAAAIRAQHPERAVRFDVVGDGKCLEAVKTLARELGLGTDRIQFLGTVPKKDIPHYLARCRATIITYDGPEAVYRNSISNKFFDSIAAGKPVFANFVGFSSLVAKEAGVGTILSREQINAAADMLISMLDDDVFLRNAKIAAHKLASETFSWDRLANMLEEVLRQAVHNPDPGAGIPVGAEFLAMWTAVARAERC